MSDFEKMSAFGSWLTSRKVVLMSELFAISVNPRKTADEIRVKAGHVEATQSALEAFTELYNGDLGTFMKERLGVEQAEDE